MTFRWHSYKKQYSIYLFRTSTESFRNSNASHLTNLKSINLLSSDSVNKLGIQKRNKIKTIIFEVNVIVGQAKRELL